MRLHAASGGRRVSIGRRSTPLSKGFASARAGAGAAAAGEGASEASGEGASEASGGGRGGVGPEAPEGRVMVVAGTVVAGPGTAAVPRPCSTKPIT